MKICFVLFVMVQSVLVSAQNVVSPTEIDQNTYDDPVESGLPAETADASKYEFRKQGLLIYPTRTAAIVNVIFTVENDSRHTGEFYDAAGHLLRKVILDAIHNEINLKDLEEGNYILRVFSPANPVTETSIIIDKSLAEP